MKTGGGFTLYAEEIPQPIAVPQTVFDYLEEIKDCLQEIEMVSTLTVEDIYNREAILEEFQKLVDAYMEELTLYDPYD